MRSKWVPMRLTSAARSTRTRRSPNRSASARSSSKACAPTCPLPARSDASQDNRIAGASRSRTMTQDEQKQAVAREAIKYVVDDAVIGVGSGSTANFFIDELAKVKHRIRGAVASSIRTADRL